jgi:hypothetical protein
MDQQQEEQRDWKGYGSAERPVVVSFYDVEDDHGEHLLLSMNEPRYPGPLWGSGQASERQRVCRLLRGWDRPVPPRLDRCENASR